MSRNKFDVEDLKSQTLLVNECRARMRVGGFFISNLLRNQGGWGCGWYLDKNHHIHVGLTYQRQICASAFSPGTGMGIEQDGEVGLLDAESKRIVERREGDPEEIKNRSMREKREAHEAIIARLEAAQAAVDAAPEDANRVAIANAIINPAED